VAKQTGITGTVTIGDANGVSQTFSGNVQTFNINQSRAQIDVTGIDKQFMERLPGLGDYSIDLSGVYDGAGTATAIQTFASMGTALRAFTIAVGPVGTAVGTAALATFNVSRGGDGALSWTATLNCANGTAMAWS
jgi:hypothetical protein